MSSAYTFIPWVRQGALTSITEADEHPHAAKLPDHASFDVTLKINGQAEPKPVSISLYGPGEVRGFDHRQIVRTEPKPYTSDFEPNYFAAIEFDRPDFPWLFTPAAPGTANQLRPWICLVVVPRDDEAIELRADGSRPLPVLRLSANAGRQLPDLSESWAWAHAQVAGELTASETLTRLLEQSPERTVARLICPRRLDPATAYYACVVPAFEAGRRAGLGEDVPDPPQGAKGLGPAWNPATNDVELPAYYHWEFSTGPAGDFESLVTLLERRPAPASAGAQPMDIGDARGGLPGIAPSNAAAVVPLEGALRAPDLASPAPPTGPQNFRTKLESILNAPAALQATDPMLPGIVGPPIYGRWHALARARVPSPTQRPPWVRELNLDPRYRAAAGFGTRVVQEDQEALMEAAWDQVDEIEAVNALLRRAQLARTTANALYARELIALEPGPLLSVAHAAKTRILMSPHTLAREIARSALPGAALSPAFRRITRPRGPLARRQIPAGERFMRPFVERLSSRDVVPAPPRKAPSGTASLADAVERFFPWFLPRWLRALLPRLPLVLLGVALLLLFVALLLLLLPVPAAVAAVLGAIALILAGIGAWLRSYLPRWRVATAVQPPALTPEAVADVPGRPDFALVPRSAAAPAEPTATVGPDNELGARFRDAAAAHFRGLRGTLDLEAAPPSPPFPFGEVRRTLLERLDPATTVPGAVLPQIDVSQLEWEPDDPLEEVLVAPTFPTPMYKRLREVAKDMLLPGVDRIPTNSVILLETNPRFIEAFMVGLNHEMSRELLWREYPTDMRGTYFRQFWDTRGRVPQPATDEEREKAYDIPPIHDWPRTNRLGETVSGGKPEGMLVLLIRGQLLLRYPTTVIYASKADRRPCEKDRKPIAQPTQVERYPLFSGTFPPDITFLGFDLTAEEARGGQAPAPESDEPDPGPGWFFVFQQQPTELRFGLDDPPPAGITPPASTGGPTSPFAVLTWADVASKDNHLSVEDSKSRPKVQPLLTHGWGRTAADMAYAVMQSPYRVAISADDMLGGA